MAWELGGGGGRRQRDQFSASSTRTQRAGQSTKVFGAGGSSRRGAESCDGFRQKQPQTPDTSAAAVGGPEEAAPCSPCAGLRAIFSFSAEGLAVRAAVGCGQQAEGDGQDNSASSWPILEPSGGKPRPLRARLPLCRPCPELRCPGMASASATRDTGATGAGRGAAGREMLCPGRPGRIRPFPSPGVQGRGEAGVMGWPSVGQHLPKSHSTKSAPWSVPRLPPAPQTAGHPPCSTPGQGHAWASAVVLRPARLFVKRRAKRGRKMLFPGPGRQSRRGS